MAPPSLIIGHGRSGTNLVLDLIDAHPDTCCRNEPNYVDEGVFSELLGDVDLTTRYGFDAEAWRAACERALFSRSFRDRPSYAWKSYVRHDRIGRWSAELAARHRLRRRVIGRVLPRYAGAEFPLPHSLAPESALRRARLVVKMLQANQLPSHLDDLGAPYQLVHIVRDPYDVVRSWALRWLVQQDRERVRRDLQRRITGYFEQFAHPLRSELRGDLNVYELELLAVVLGDQHLFRSMREQPHYLLVTYDFAHRSRLACARLMYEFLDLDWSAAIEQRVRELENVLFAELPPTQAYERTDFMARVLQQSSLHQVLAEQPYLRGGSCVGPPPKG